MRGVSWRFASQAETVTFRNGRGARMKGFFDPRDGDAKCIFEVAERSTVNGLEGPVDVPAGETIKVLTDADLLKHGQADWIYTAVNLRVRYRGGVESLSPGTPVAILPRDLEPE